MNASEPNAARAPRYPLARLSPAKDELLAIEITRESVDQCDIQPMLEKLEFLSETAEGALLWEGKLAAYFAGWDRDPRETAQIPEIRAYFAALTDSWPYWLHFVEKTGDTLPHILRLLCAGHVERISAGMVGWQFEDVHDVTRLTLVLFEHMNELHDRLGLLEALNERISQEVAQLIECSLQ
jgi:hypothetical protein